MILVYFTIRKCYESTEQLGGKIPIPASRNRQVRLVYRFLASCDVSAPEEARRKRYIPIRIFVFLLHLTVFFFTSALERALSHSNPDEPFSSSNKWKELPIVEESEPNTPDATARRRFPLNSHKRELAEVDDVNE